MKTIYKYFLSHGVTNILMPCGAKLLDIQTQGTDIVLWAEVTPDAEKEKRCIVGIFTGEPFDLLSGRYLATTQVGNLVYHFYESDL